MSNATPAQTLYLGIWLFHVTVLINFMRFCLYPWTFNVVKSSIVAICLKAADCVTFCLFSFALYAFLIYFVSFPFGG